MCIHLSVHPPISLFYTSVHLYCILLSDLAAICFVFWVQWGVSSHVIWTCICISIWWVCELLYKSWIQTMQHSTLFILDMLMVLWFHNPHHQIVMWISHQFEVIQHKNNAKHFIQGVWPEAGIWCNLVLIWCHAISVTIISMQSFQFVILKIFGLFLWDLLLL